MRRKFAGIYIHIGELKSQFRSAHQSPVYLNWRIFVDLLLFLNLRWLRRGRSGIHCVRLEFGKDPLRRTRILRHSADTKPITANSGTYLPRDCCALLSTCHSNSRVWLGLALSTQKKMTEIFGTNFLDSKSQNFVKEPCFSSASINPFFLCEFHKLYIIKCR